MMAANFPSSFEDSNPTKKDAIEHWLLENVDDSQQRKRHVICFLNSTSFYFTSLPDFRKWQPNFKTRVLLVIVDRDMKEDLMKCGLINWCPNVRNLIPVNVPKDGNCLLHSVATAVWGITDKSLLLRRFLCLTLGVDQDHRFQDRWLHQRQRQITQFVDRLFGSRSQVMDEEWTEIRQCLEPDRSHSVAVPHRFLEPIHVYTLANILRRPIIVLTDSTVCTLSGMSLQDNDMGGVYLPLEWSWMDTCRVPVLLGYSHNHFSPLLFTDHPKLSSTGTDAKRDLTPLVNSRFEQFPVRFLLRGEEPQVGHLLRKYLRVRETVMQVKETVQNVLCAEVEANSLPPQLNLVTDFIRDCELRFQQDTKPSPALFQVQNPALIPQDRMMVKQEHGQPSASNRPQVFPPNLTKERLQGAARPQYGLGDPTLHSAGGLVQHQILIPPPTLLPMRSFPEQSVGLNHAPEQVCRTVGCRYFGDPALGMMCSSCFRNYTIQESRQVAAAAGARPCPTAPLSSIPAQDPTQLQLSMMREKCKVNCGYYCSTKTFPYCHECASKIQKQAQEEAMAAAFNESAFAPKDREPSPPQSSSGMGPEVVPPARMPHQSREVAGNVTSSREVAGNVTSSGEVAGSVTPNVMSAPQSGTSANQPPVRGEPSDVGEADPSVSRKTPSVPAAQILEEAMTQAVVTGDPPYPLVLGGEDPNPVLLFGSGQEPASTHPGQIGLATGAEPQVAPSPLASTTSSAQVTAAEMESAGQNCLQSEMSGVEEQQHHQPTSPVPGQDLTSAACLAKSQMTPPVLTASSPGGVEAQAACANQGCGEAPLLGTLCGKCYVGQDMKSADAKSMETPGVTNLKATEPASITEQKMASMYSTHSSAPPSIAPALAPASVPKSNATYTKEAEEGFGHLESSRSQPSSLRDLRNIPHMNYTRSWIQENRFAETPLQQNPLSGPKSAPPQGLPEKPESVGLGNDLIASGAGCFSSTQWCIAEGCGNPVLQAGKLCQQCRDILRQARQGQGASAAAASSGQAEGSQPERQPCRTRDCSFYGIPQNLGYCTDCYRKHVEREVEERNRHVSQKTITVPPDFNYVYMSSERQGQLCLSAGCRLFGDPDEAGMCSAHYQQHRASIDKATRGLPAAPQRPNITSTSVTYGPGVYVTSNSVTYFKPGDAFPPPQVSVPPPPIPTSSGSREPSLGETYYRVAGRHTGTCLNPMCSNFGNSNKGGLCNGCAQDQKVNDDLISRAIFGEEEIG